MYEKVNPSHPDKIADRIAGALVDLAYKKEDRPKVAVEVLIGHGWCHIISETSVHFGYDEVHDIVSRIAGKVQVDYDENRQDVHLADNQGEKIRCGDNGIFKGVPLTDEEVYLSYWARRAYAYLPYDGKFIINGDAVTICQSNATEEEIGEIFVMSGYKKTINPLGYWTGGTDVDSGATNRKLGSDMAQSVTGGGLHGKDLSKADVSVNIYAFLKAQKEKKPVELYCSIGDETVDGKPYSEIVEIAREYIGKIGGFEKFAEWGLV